MPKSEDREMRDKCGELRCEIRTLNLGPTIQIRLLELLDERDKLSREALMAQGLISGLHADRENLRISLAHVVGELSMFDHGEPDGAFEDCAECEAARQILIP